MIADIKTAAEAVGVTAVITNSQEKIETQLNRIQRVEDLPIMLVSWDLESTLSFDENGFLRNPQTQVVLLLMDKAQDTSKDEAEIVAENMAKLFQQFIQKLYTQIIPYQRQTAEEILSNISYTLVPQHGLGKHSGVMGRFTMSDYIANCE